MSALPSEIVSVGSAINTLVQRVVAAIGLAGVTALTTIQKAQLFANRNSMLQRNGANSNPQLTQMQSQGTGGLLPLFDQLTHEITAQTYSDVFLVVGVCVLAAVPLALLLPKTSPVAGSAAPVEM